MQEIITAWPFLIPFCILFVLAAMLSFAFYIFLVKPSAEDIAFDRWRCRLRRAELRIASRFRGAFIFGACVGALVMVISWILFLPNSPASPSLKFSIALVQVAPMFLSDLLTGNTHESEAGRTVVFWLLVFAKWFLVGFILFALTRIGRNK
ncbi:MAG: hypothetical protein ABSE90_00780 [Verrucomicrobiota bacterium]|jgi:hypothetical protein